MAMNENQQRLIKKLQWILIPAFILIAGFSFGPYITTGNREEADAAFRKFFLFTEMLMIIPYWLHWDL